MSTSVSVCIALSYSACYCTPTKQSNASSAKAVVWITQARRVPDRRRKRMKCNHTRTDRWRSDCLAAGLWRRWQECVHWLQSWGPTTEFACHCQPSARTGSCQPVQCRRRSRNASTSAEHRTHASYTRLHARQRLRREPATQCDIKTMTTNCRRGRAWAQH